MRVALLGLTFKAGTDDLRESPAVRLGRALLERGATVSAYDPVAVEGGTALLRAGGQPGGVDAADSASAACRGADAVVVATEWPEFADLDWRALASAMVGRVVVDSRGVVDAAAAAAAGLRVVALGVEVRGVALQPAG
jgi:UDPglucose 6-dehydrogenase